MALPTPAESAANGPAVVVRVKNLIGKVATIDAKAGTLTLSIDKRQEFITCGPECRFGDEADGLASLAELRVGEPVYARCHEEDGRLVAERVARVKPQKAKNKPQPAPKKP